MFIQQCQSRPYKKTKETHDENENVITNNDINAIKERNNQLNVEKNRYVAKDDGNNKVDNTITMGNDYLFGAEIKVKDDVSKNEKDSSLSLYHRKYIHSGRNDERANINQTQYSLSCTERQTNSIGRYKQGTQ